MNYDDISKKFNELLATGQKIVVMQADNPDGDSLASSLALESILEDAGKNVYMYCAIDMPDYLKHLPGWDRVNKEFPSNYDLAIVVDTGVWKLFGNFEEKYGRHKLPAERLIVIDEHDTLHSIECRVDIHDIKAVSSGQIVYELAKACNLNVSKLSAELIASSILSDTLGLTSSTLAGNPRPFQIMAELVGIGVDVSELQEKRIERMKISSDILNYKGDLIQRIEYFADGRIASITIPYDELREHSQELNPTIVLDEARMVEGVAVTIGFKQYVSQGRLVRITGRVRCNRGFEIADKIAGLFEDGGGHTYASGFKVEGDNLDFNEIKTKVLQYTERLLNENI
jgi:nanoRNase/pAp phosphatase (c-di-AMP/oligoRNAs hydrolase)